ncbi:glycosyltransferase family 39 protein [Paenibacillus aurantius]|uniref:Glycosyltransferase family 39 protein n=1 Tax=Paenibacillus aurantius TaxID=2918900 RepID=A0AA96RDM0_9BACL|nr:glycosyltransferase family 39 protein [Paenibacillus aurantius]WNQ11530.1 glycosyltransferase family 39 protein [Paenibacillus aurantius]
MERKLLSMESPRIRWMLWLLLGGSLLLKILLVLLHGAAYDYHSDDRGYLESARILLETGRFTYNDPSRPTAFITPALPGFLAAVMTITGPGLILEQTVRILQAVMVTGALWLLYRIGLRMVSAKASLLAVALCCLYPPLWLVSNFIFTEALFTLLVMLLLYMALLAEERPTWSRALLFGLVWAAAVYVRPTIALWPGLLFLLLLYRRNIPWPRLIRSGLVTAAVFVLCLLPWWVRNYEVSGGEFIPLTRASGNPLLLGTYPWTVPSLFLEEQRTWHTTDDLWINDQIDRERAMERIKEGFTHSFWTYASWYTVGKFLLFWGDVFYWMPIPGVPLAAAILCHYVILLPGFIGMWKARRHPVAQVILLLLGYMSLLHMIYLAHSRYSVPLMPLVALFAASYLLSLRRLRKPAPASAAS